MPSRIYNTFRISAERNQTQRYETRLEVHYGRTNWRLRVFFVAANPDRVLSRTAAAIRFLQREEEKLWLWGADPADRELLFKELLNQAEFKLDRRRNFPRAATTLVASSGESLTPLSLAELKRKLSARLQALARPAHKARVLARSA